MFKKLLLVCVFVLGLSVYAQAADFVTAEEIQQEHKDIDEAGKGEMVGLKLPFRARRGDQVYLWREKRKKVEGERNGSSSCPTASIAAR